MSPHKEKERLPEAHRHPRFGAWMPSNGGGLFRSATRASLSRRSASMARAVLWARVCRRLGIITPRWPLLSGVGGSPVHRVPVGSHSFGNRCLLPG